MTGASAQNFGDPKYNVSFRPFRDGDEEPFRLLNEEWIAKLFGIEEKDRITLADPVGKIIKSGGRIFMADVDSDPAGCCALLAMSPGEFELAKMAVTASQQGRGLGRQILQYTVEQARKIGASRLYLETNSSLANAIHLYEAVGFHHVPPERRIPSPYARADVFMEMFL